MATKTNLVTGVDFITLSTEDIDEAVKFYGDVLGLERGKQWGNMPAYEFETGNLTIAVMQSDGFGVDHGTNSHPIEFRVEDFEAAKEELESKGVEFQGDVIDSGVCKQAFFQDPDGNTLGIHHRYAEGTSPIAS